MYSLHTMYFCDLFMLPINVIMNWIQTVCAYKITSIIIIITNCVCKPIGKSYIYKSVTTELIFN